MKNKFRHVWLVLLAVSLARMGAALTLEDAVGQAMNQSPDLARLRAAREGASWKRIEAAGGYLPRLDMRADRVIDTKYGTLNVHFGPGVVNFPEAFPAITADFDVVWTVFDGFGSAFAWSAADKELQAADIEFDVQAFKLKRQVTLLFYQALAARQLENVAARNLETLQSHLDLASATEESGLGTRFDVLRIEALLEEAKAEQDAAHDATASALENLGQALGLSGPAANPEGDLPVPPEHPESLMTTQGGADRPEIKAFEKRAAALDDASLAAGSAWFPRLALTYNKEFYRYIDFDPVIVPNGEYADSYMIGVRASWDIFDGGVSIARQRQASWRAEQARQALAAARLRANDEPAFWSRRLKTSAALYRARLRTLEKSEESVRLATLGLKTGTRTSTEVLDAELDLFRSRAGLVKAQTDAAEAKLNLEIALGRELK